ncbi:MAG: OsmC family protein, partial [Phycisphaerales bacterium]|nr:OsmC family protein [Phycisphaerales bacterium]
EGEFANTNFSSNVGDLVAAANYMREHLEAPEVLVGHSLGGAAVLAASHQVPEVRAVATVGAPYDPGHVSHLFADHLEDIEREGVAEVTLAGRPFTIQKQFIDDIQSQKQDACISNLKRALLVLHSPVDNIVGIENASLIFQAAKHPKSFISLDSADHLLSKKADVEYAAAVISAWAARFISREEAPMPVLPPQPHGKVVIEETTNGKFQNAVAMGQHRAITDEPPEVGGDDTGPSPYEYLLASLGACTSMTLRMYAERKGWPLEKVRVALSHQKIHARDCETCETEKGKVDQIERTITIYGGLDDEQRARLMQIADMCPVHRTLHSEINEITREG